MNQRRVLAALAVVVLAGFAGCVGGPGTGAEGVPSNVTYAWHANATGNATTSDVTVNVTQDYYFAVYNVDNRSQLTFTRPSELGGNTAVTVGSPAFRYPNGTVTRNVTVNQGDSQTTVTMPADHGQFAFVSPSTTREVVVPVAVNGSHDVALPPNMRAELPVLGYVTPGGSQLGFQDNRAHYRWTHVDSNTIDIRYYLQRDAYIFGGLLVALAVLAVVGVLYLRRQVQQLQKSRREAGLDMEER